MTNTEKIIDLYRRECANSFIAQALEVEETEVENVIANYLFERICSLWLETDLSQAAIACKLGVPPSFIYKTVVSAFSVEQRIARKSRMQRMVQTDERVAPPSWYTGSGRSVPLKIIEYCEMMGLTKLPEGMSVILISQGVFALMTKAEAKALSHARSILVGDTDATKPQD